MRALSNSYRQGLVASIVRFVIIGECIAFPLWGLTHAARAPANTQTLTEFNTSRFCASPIAVRSLESVTKYAYAKSAPTVASSRRFPTAAPMDPLSRQLFASRDVKFSYVSGQKTQCQAFEIFLFGKRLSKLDYTELVAAPSGSRIRVRTSVLPPRLMILVDNPLYQVTQVRSLFKYRGNVEMGNDGWIVRDDAPAGVATRVVGRQVYMAHRIGVREIGVWAAGSYEDPEFNGYYTWPRLGFNVPLADYKEPLEADGFHNVTDTNDLFSRPGGPEWWKRHGKDCYGLFDLDPKSVSSIALRRYLKAKGAVPYEGAD